MLRFATSSIVAVLFCAAAGLFVSARPVAAQNLTRGFNLTLPASASSSELASQPDLWMMEVSFKPMRMIRVEVTDPQTKQKKRELIWYLVWKAVNRTLERPADDGPAKPVNENETLPKPFFAPEFTLVTNDNGVQHVYPDVIIPEAQAAIAARERMSLKNPVEIAQELPAPTAADAEQQTVLEGVAMWKGVDPNTDYFTVFASGFGSAYQITNGPDDKPLIWRKTIIQEFWRPSDSIDERETEIRRLDELQPSTKAQHAPRWIYRADGDVSPNPQDLPETEPAGAGGNEAPGGEGDQPAPGNG